METAVLNKQGEKIGTCKLPEMLFGLKTQPHFLYEAVTVYLSNQRAGSACAKTRAEVSGGGKKPWKQKHTGRARHGSTRSPIWRKGGVVFGPRPHSFRKDFPAAKRQLALAQALSGKFADGNLIVVDKLDISAPKTKELFSIMKTLKAGTKPLVVSMRKDKNLEVAQKNLSGLDHRLPADLNAYVVLRSSKVIITKDALETMQSFLKEGESK